MWDGDDARRCSLGGGSGLVPLMAMLRLARATGRADLVHLVVSVRTPDDLYYARRARRARTPPSSTRARRRRRRPVPPGASPPTTSHPHLRADATVYVCGSAPFADAVGDLVLDLGVAPSG